MYSVYETIRKCELEISKIYYRLSESLPLNIQTKT